MPVEEVEVEEPFPSILGGGDEVSDAFADDVDGGESAQDAIADALLEARSADADAGEEVEEPATTETPAAEAPAALQEWSKPLQSVQQELANNKKDFATMQATLLTIVEKITAMPNPGATPAAQQDRLVEIEQLLADPAFDPYEKGGAVLKSLAAELKAIRTENSTLKTKLNTAEQSQSLATQAEAKWAEWSAANPDVGRQKGETLWNEALAEANADTALSANEKLGAAKVLWNLKVKAAKGKPAVTAGKPAATVPARSGGTLAPQSGRAGGAPVKVKTIEENVAAGRYRLSEEFT